MYIYIWFVSGRHALPNIYQDLMINPKSKIIDFYPKTFQIDMNGKKQ
jgi:5'-3' exoribonuclease 2